MKDKLLQIIDRKMKKIFLMLAAAFMTASIMSAQEDINKAIELANNGNEAFQMGEYQLAVDAFTQSLAIAEGLGEVQRAITSSERVFALLDLEEEIPEAAAVGFDDFDDTDQY